MSGTVSKRSLLAGAGCAAAGSLVARLISAAEAQQATQPQTASTFTTIFPQFAELRVQAIE